MWFWGQQNFLGSYFVIKLIDEEEGSFSRKDKENGRWNFLVGNDFMLVLSKIFNFTVEKCELVWEWVESMKNKKFWEN